MKHWTQELREVIGNADAVRAIARREIRAAGPNDRLPLTRNIARDDGTPEGNAAYEGAGHLLAGAVGPLAAESRLAVKGWLKLIDIDGAGLVHRL